MSVKKVLISNRVPEVGQQFFGYIARGPSLGDCWETTEVRHVSDDGGGIYTFWTRSGSCYMVEHTRSIDLCFMSMKTRKSVRLGTLVGVVNRIEAEDGSGHSWNLHMSTREGNISIYWREGQAPHVI